MHFDSPLLKERVGAGREPAREHAEREREREREIGKFRERAFRNGDITLEFALFMSCHGTPAGITDGRRGCKAMMAVYQSCINERPRSSGGVTMIIRYVPRV